MFRGGAVRVGAVLAAYPYYAHAVAACNEIDQIAIQRGGGQAGDEVFEVTGFPIGLAEGAAEQTAGGLGVVAPLAAR